MSATTTKAQEEVKDRILAERDKGNLVVMGLEGMMAMPIEEFVKQPADGMLYDLNRGEEVSLTFLHERKWVNDFAVALVIRKLVEQRDAAIASVRPEGATMSEQHRTTAPLTACTNAEGPASEGCMLPLDVAEHLYAFKMMHDGPCEKCDELRRLVTPNPSIMLEREQRTAHSKSEYRRVTEQGGKTNPPEPQSQPTKEKL